MQIGHIRFLVNMILYVDFGIEARNLNSIHEVWKLTVLLKMFPRKRNFLILSVCSCVSAVFVSKNIAVCMDFNIHYLKYMSRRGKVKKKKLATVRWFVWWEVAGMNYLTIFKIFPSFYHSDPHTLDFVCFWRDSLQWARTFWFTRFLDHTQRRTTVGRTPLDEWSARRIIL